MTKSLLLLSLCCCLHAYAQPNCNIYKTNGNDSCYQACLIATSGFGAQGSKISQMRFDKAIEGCPVLDYAYMEKAVPYLKRGDFATWKTLIDKAVDLNPLGHLGYRGWCRYQFLRDYEGAIRDLELLDSLKTGDLGYSINGDYQLNVAKALCYKALGQKQKAIQTIEAQLAQKGYVPLMFDYLHLGVLKLETGDIDGGIASLTQSIALNDYLAEAYYYRALAYQQKDMIAAFRTDMEKAREFYAKRYRRDDPYAQPMDKIYLSDIEGALKKG